MFRGSMVALVTLMQANGEIDRKSFFELIEWHITAKTNAIVVAGTTGEAATLNTEEHLSLIKEAVACADNRIPIIAGTGSYSTQHALELTRSAAKVGAKAALIVTPYYNKPTQAGLYEHYKTIASEVNIPIILYNVPGRTACDLLPETTARLAKIPNVIGIKEATQQISRIKALRAACPEDFLIFSGEDNANYDIIANGANGIISVTANIIPRKMHEFCEMALSNDNKSPAEKLHRDLLPLHKVLFLESNPIPVKWALHQMQKIPNGIRLPLLPLDEKYQAELLSVLQQMNIVQ